MGEYVWDQEARLRCLREYLGMSVAELSAVLQVSPRSYQSFESGRSAIPVGVLEDVNELVHRFDEKAGEFSEMEVVSIKDLSRFDFRAASIAAAGNEKLHLVR